MSQDRQNSSRYPGVHWRINLKGEKTYYIRYRTGGRGSKQTEEPVGKSSEGMTEAKAASIRASRITGKAPSNRTKRQNLQAEKLQKLKLKDAWNVYEELTQGRPIYRTDKCLISFFRNLLEKPIQDLSTTDIDQLRKKLESTPAKRSKGDPKMLTPSTVRHILGLIRRLVNFAVDRGLTPPPANLSFKMPSVDNLKTEVLTDEQLKRYLQALDEEPDQDAAAFLRLALATGMRKGALLGLRWDDCDFERNFIVLRGETAKKGKTDSIPMTAGVKSILESIQKRDNDYVFPGRNGGKRADFRRMARRVKEKAGLPEDFRPLHGLRHNFASRLASSGKVELYTLQKLLTHSSPAMTQRYAHLRDETLRKAAAIADEMLTAGKTAENE